MANAQLGSKAVGSIIKINESGSPVEFIVCKHDYESGLNGSGRTLVVRKDCYDNRQWHSSNVNAYATSAIDSWLNSTYKNLLDTDIRGVIGTTKIKYTPGKGDNTVGTLERAIFLLSLTELGKAPSYANKEGTALSIASSLQIAYLAGSAAAQWTRSPFRNSRDFACHLISDGNVDASYCASSYGSRPAFTLSSDALVDDSGNVVIPDLTAHKTLVNGTTYTVKSGKCMVGGTVYNILKGRTLIGGTGYDIALPSAGTKIETLDVGQSVFANVNGQKTEFLVVHHGFPSSLYDASCDGTWLLMKDCYAPRTWHSSTRNIYETSAINAYLNGDFYNLFDPDIQSIIKQVKIPYRKNGGSGGTDQSGANGLLCKIFLLSGYEVGWTTSDYSGIPVDGAKLAYFESGTGTSANSRRIAYRNGTAIGWWTRSPNTGSSSKLTLVYTNGNMASVSAFPSAYGVRPALVLPSDALVDDEFNLIA